MIEVNSMTVVSVMNVVYFQVLVRFFFFLSFGATALIGPGPPHSPGL